MARGTHRANGSWLALFAASAFVGACGGGARTPAAPSTPAAPAMTSPCPPPDEAAPSKAGFATVALCKDLYGDPAFSEEERAVVRRAFTDALAATKAAFGDDAKTPAVVACKSDACALAFGGPSRRSRAFLEPRPYVMVNEGAGPLVKGTTIHEMIHVVIALRMGKARPRLPTWFDEGVATFIGDNGHCTPKRDERPRRAIDDLRRLDTGYAWEGFTSMAGKISPAYCQARDEVGAWIAKRGREAVLKVIDGVAAGGSFDELYGQLVTAISRAEYDRSLDARFPLDENEGTNAVDVTGRAHVGSLMGGAIWTTGRRGAGVKVNDGAVVRVDGLSELGITDSPFTVALWAKPLGRGHVLIHSAKNTSGTNGWCIPLLGNDAQGRITAQLNVAPDPKAFLTATGPELRANTWHHVAVTWSKENGLRLYVNGAEAAHAAAKTEAERHRFAPAAPMVLFVGSDHGAACWTSTIEHGDWNGVVDELRVYDYELDAAAIADDMRGP